MSARNLLRALVVGGSLFVAFGCGGALDEPAPDVLAPRTETFGAVSFQVPSNWTATTEYEPGIRNTTVQSSGNALMMVQEFDENVGIDATSYADTLQVEYQNQMKEAFGDAIQMTPGVIGSVSRTWFGQSHAGATVPVSLGAFGVVVPHTLEVFQREVGGHTLIVFTQVAVEDEAVVRPGFDLVLSTMAAK
jgi:hypothetical protein